MKGAFGLLDRYVLQRFAGAYGVCVLGFVTLFLVMRIPGDIDDFQDAAHVIEGRGDGVFGTAVVYYIAKLPRILTIVGPFLTLFAGIAAVQSLARHHEFTPMVGAGRSPHRVLAPVYILAVLLTLLLVSVEEILVPRASVRTSAIKAILDGEHDEREVEAFSTGGNNYSATAWLPEEEALVGMRCLDWTDPDGELPPGSLTVARVHYGRMATTGEIGWFPDEGVLQPIGRDAAGRPQAAIELPYDRALPLDFTPGVLDLLTEDEPGNLSRHHLTQLIARYPLNRKLQSDLHARTTRPLASLILFLLGLPFITRPGETSITIGLAVAVGASMSYFAVTMLFTELGNRGDLLPLAAAWTPPAFFGAIALARLESVGRS
jgi:lipopolysaccharide export system permease protein